jgi:hypothetical protein
MTYYDLLCNPNYFNRFLRVFNSRYDPTLKEPHYRDVILRYQRLSTADPYESLLYDPAHIFSAYESLRVEFGMGKRSAKLVKFDKFIVSIQGHAKQFKTLNTYSFNQMSHTTAYNAVLPILKLLFHELAVVPENEKDPAKTPKLVAVSKTLHFFLPNLVMPVDRQSVLQFLYLKDNTPDHVDKQFALFVEVFGKYVNLYQRLGISADRGTYDWWNVSIPKRIDNAISGFWQVFNPANIQSTVCTHIDTLLTELRVPSQ